MEVLYPKEVSGGRMWAVCCPYCHTRGKTPDTKYHMHLLPGQWAYCYRCSYKTSYVKFLSNNTVRGLSDRIDAPKRIVERVEVKPDAFDLYIKDNTEELSTTSFSKRCFVNYLTRRGITGDLVAKYGLRAGINNLSGRVVFIDAVNKYFVGRAVWETVQPKTLNPGPTVVASKPFMYFDNTDKEVLYIVEGTFDSVPFAKAGKDFACVLGKDLSPMQVRQMTERKIQNVIFALDPDAFHNSMMLAEKLHSFIPDSNVGVLSYDIKVRGRDPSDLDTSIFNLSTPFWVKRGKYETKT